MIRTYYWWDAPRADKERRYGIYIGLYAWEEHQSNKIRTYEEIKTHEPDTDALQREILKEYRPALEREQKQESRQRQVLEKKLAHRKDVAVFFQNAKMGRADYVTAYGALQRYVTQQGTLADLCDTINTHLQETPVLWHLESDGKHCMLDQDMAGTLSAWKELALLVESGVTLARFRVCKLPECGKLFWDDTPNGEKHHCILKHKDAAGHRKFRRTPKGQKAEQARQAKRKGRTRFRREISEKLNRHH